jgi:hypothetical protein
VQEGLDLGLGFMERVLTKVVEVKRGQESVAAWLRKADAGADLACRG